MNNSYNKQNGGSNMFGNTTSSKQKGLTRKEAREQGLWFVSKRFGWGWSPVTWQGWLGILLYVALLLREIERATYFDKYISNSGSDTLLEVAPGLVLLTMMLILLCYAKGEKPRWRWWR